MTSWQKVKQLALTVSEKWSLFKEKVLNKDFLAKMANYGPYLVLVLSESPYFSKSVNEKLFCAISPVFITLYLFF